VSPDGPRKDEIAFRCGEVVMNLLKLGIRPSNILTHAAFEMQLLVCHHWRLDQRRASPARDFTREWATSPDR